jgi:hypothetical protein
MRKKESMLEHFNPKLCKVLSQPPSKFNCRKRPRSAQSSRKKLGRKSMKEIKNQVQHNALFFKKQAEFQSIVKKREHDLKIVEDSVKIKKRKHMDLFKIKKQ